ncbi:MAG: PEPxxWA-CTERM sorting domain-containing protein [Pseudomonadota bacterium]
MFRTDSANAPRGPLSGALKAAIPALAFAASLASASMAQAATYIFTRGDMDHARTVNISGIGNVKAGPVQFDGTVDGSPFDNLVAFCVDVYHSISLGNYNPDLTYTDEIDLTTDSHPWNPTPLNDDQVVQISKLVNYGTNVFYSAPAGNWSQMNARWDELAAVQGAIWQVVSGRNVKHNNGFGALDSRINNLAGINYATFFNTDYGPVGSNIDFLTPFKGSYEYPSKKLTQSFAISAPIPEPGTWVMMIGGFAVAGAMLRRSRSRKAVLAA